MSRTLPIPDHARLERMRHAPALGSRPLFFSGGTALRRVSRRLIEYTHNSVHLITPFDSGGSSATLRAAFDMPAVGDLRNRLMALADRSAHGHPEVYALFGYRFPEDGDPSVPRAHLVRMADGDDPRIRAVPEPLRAVVRSHLGFFMESMPDDFDLRGASVGNLVLAGGYLREGRRLEPVLFLFSRLAGVRGVVRPIVDESLHLAATLADGRTVVGQHLLTGRNAPSMESRVRSVFLTRSAASAEVWATRIPEGVAELIRSADLICYAMGSFYTSLLATLLPGGVSETVARTDVPKVYVPNTGHDPEEVGLDLVGKVRTLLGVLRQGSPPGTRPGALLDHVLVDATGAGLHDAELEEVETWGVRVVDTPLITDNSAPYLDDRLLVEALLSLARE